MNIGPVVRKAAKAAVLPTGLLARRGACDVVILLYHRVGEGDREIDISRESLEDQLAFLAEREHPITLDQALSDESDGGVVVSIDDGLADFHRYMVPLLERYRVPAILYLATGFVADNGKAKSSDALHWSQLQEAVSTGLVTIGAHTHSHADLSKADERFAELEMRGSKEMIEDRLQVPCRHFSYPWSLSSPAAERVARRTFHSAALTWRTNRSGRLDRHRLGRTPVLRNDGDFFFRAKVHGLLDGEAYVYRALRRGPWRRP